MHEFTPEERAAIEEAVGESVESLGERLAIGVLDDLANDEDPVDGLEERRYWLSPAGREREIWEAYESGRPMSPDDY